MLAACRAVARTDDYVHSDTKKEWNSAKTCLNTGKVRASVPPPGPSFLLPDPLAPPSPPKGRPVRRQLHLPPSLTLRHRPHRLTSRLTGDGLVRAPDPTVDLDRDWRKGLDVRCDRVDLARDARRGHLERVKQDRVATRCTFRNGQANASVLADHWMMERRGGGGLTQSRA